MDCKDNGASERVGRSRLAVLIDGENASPRHQPAHVRGKNAADIALAIDAEDLRCRPRFDGFLFMNSDSDFTRRARTKRLTEAEG